jgi:ABC-type Fe3+-hydroxamate transport system substrate-binding protein
MAPSSWLLLCAMILATALGACSTNGCGAPIQPRAAVGESARIVSLVPSTTELLFAVGAGPAK